MEHRHYDPVWNFGQKSQKLVGIDKPCISEEEIVELLTCENLNESTEDLNTSEDGQRTFLNEIIEKVMKCGQKEKEQNVTARDLYINKLATANSIS